MNLYQISSQYQQVLHNIDLVEEVNLQDMDALNDIHDALEDKAVNIAAYIKNLEAERNAIEEARKSMSEREKRIDTKVDWLTNYLKQSMESCNVDEVSKSPYFTIKIKKCPPSVVVTNEDLISSDYKKVKEVVTIDKVKIKNELSNGVVIEGATLQQATRLEIK